jgi:hypothetical protein
MIPLNSFSFLNSNTGTTPTSTSTIIPFNTSSFIKSKSNNNNGVYVVSHTINLNEDTKTVISTVVYSDGTEDVKALSLTNFYNNAYNNGQSAVDFNSHTYETINGLINVNVSITNGKLLNFDIPLDEQLIINAYNSIMANNGEGLKIKQNGIEYSFYVENRQSTPITNVAYNPAIDGTPVYEQLGNPEKKMEFYISC